MEKKQSSIDWLVSQLQKSKDWHRLLNEVSQMSTAKIDIIEQAKAIHKEEVEDAYCKAGLDIAHNDSIKESGLAQEYYIEAYGGDDE